MNTKHFQTFAIVGVLSFAIAGCATKAGTSQAENQPTMTNTTAGGIQKAMITWSAPQN